MANEAIYKATGRRKEASARVILRPGSGTINVNKRSLEDYFPRETLRMIIQQPFEVCELAGKYDTTVLVTGGGTSAQAGAIRHGISRALVVLDENLKTKLKKISREKPVPSFKTVDTIFENAA